DEVRGGPAGDVLGTVVGRVHTARDDRGMVDSVELRRQPRDDWAQVGVVGDVGRRGGEVLRHLTPWKLRGRVAQRVLFGALRSRGRGAEIHADESARSVAMDYVRWGMRFGLTGDVTGGQGP